MASLVLHGLVLFVPTREKPAAGSRPLPRLEASLAPREPTPPAVEMSPPAPPAEKSVPAPSRPKKRILAVEKPRGSTARDSTPKWSVAQKQEMDKFLNELGGQGKAPTLAQRSLAMAHGIGRETPAQAGEAGGVSLESLPNSPPVDPFSLDFYVDGLLKKLNRSAAFVRNDPRAKGVKTASVQIRLNPDGSLKSFRVINAADQQEEIAFVKSVVERAVPFAPFPPDMRKSAGSLAMTICIRPSRWDGGFGFMRNGGSDC